MVVAMASRPTGWAARVMESMRSFPIGNYVIFFRYDPTEMVVLSVLHGNRDVIAPVSDDEGGIEN